MNWQMKENFKPQDGNLTHWTRLAKECYSIKSDCRHCDFVPKHFRYICQVKRYIPFLCEKFGEPKK